MGFHMQMALECCFQSICLKHENNLNLSAEPRQIDKYKYLRMKKRSHTCRVMILKMSSWKDDETREL